MVTQKAPKGNLGAFFGRVAPDFVIQMTELTSHVHKSLPDWPILLPA